MQTQRVDLESFKQKLKIVLKENATIYWENLKKFAQSKLTKPELDEYAKAVLKTPENVSLHNLFVKSILNNAYSNTLPPIPLESQKKIGLKRKSFSDIKDKNKRTQQKQKLSGLSKSTPLTASSTAPTSDFTTAIAAPSTTTSASPAITTTSSASAKTETTPATAPESQMVPRLHTQAILQKGESSSAHQQILQHPELLALRTRMYRVAAEVGLNHVSNECILMMMNALETFLLKIISNMKVSPAHCTPVQSPPNLPPIKIVDSSDLFQTIQSKPQLLGELMTLYLERIQDLID